jgi:hypothetical protein
VHIATVDLSQELPQSEAEMTRMGRTQYFITDSGGPPALTAYEVEEPDQAETSTKFI